MTSRRFAVPFNPEYFAQRSKTEGTLPLSAAFRHILDSNHWAAASASGGGADLDQTAALRLALPDLCRRLGIRTILDLPCGDGGWMAAVEWPAGTQYLGADLLPDLVAQCRARYAREGRRYVTLDLTASALPEAGLLFCRDCFVHLSYDDIERALRRIHAGRFTWLLATTFPDEASNVDIVTGDWRPLNLERAPYYFPKPAELIVEGCTEQNGLFADKSLGLWRVSDLPG